MHQLFLAISNEKDQQIAGLFHIDSSRFQAVRCLAIKPAICLMLCVLLVLKDWRLKKRGADIIFYTSPASHHVKQVKDIHLYLTVSLSLMFHPILSNVHSKKSARELIFFMGNPM